MMLSKNLALLTFLYFIQGLPYGFQAKFLPILLRSQGVSLTSVGIFKFLLAPWLCKALWAPLVDTYKTKRIWLLYSIFGLILTCLFASLITPDKLLLLSIVLFSLNFWAATQDIAVDGIAVHLLKVEELGHGNTVQVVGYKIGSIFGGGILVWFLDFLGWTALFLALALLYIEAWMFVYVSPLLHEISKSSKDKRDAIDDSVVQQSQKYQEKEDHDVNLLEEPLKGKEDAHSQSEDTNSDQQSEDQEKENEQEKKELRAHPFQFLRCVFRTPGTKWMCLYVLTYKLGEQGILGMLPLYLIDKKVSPKDVTFWAGMIGQGVSIFGSVLGGYLLTRLPVYLVVSQAALLRLMPMGVILWTTMLWNAALVTQTPLYYAIIASFCLLMLLSGIVTTATFTAMMQCSKQAPSNTQATHYTTLATLEVFGKLSFATVSGWLVDTFGYTPVFLAFVLLTVIIMPLFRYYPNELKELDTELMLRHVGSEEDEEVVTEEDEVVTEEDELISGGSVGVVNGEYENVVTTEEDALVSGEKVGEVNEEYEQLVTEDSELLSGDNEKVVSGEYENLVNREHEDVSKNEVHSKISEIPEEHRMNSSEFESSLEKDKFHCNDAESLASITSERDSDLNNKDVSQLHYVGTTDRSNISSNADNLKLTTKEKKEGVRHRKQPKKVAEHH